MRVVVVALFVAVTIAAQADAKKSALPKDEVLPKKAASHEVEGSGDDEYDDNYVYKDDDDKDDEDWSGDLFGDDEDIVKPASAPKTKVADALTPSNPNTSSKKKPGSDIHFDEAGHASKSGKTDDTLLYEYYNELYEKDYEDEDDDEDTKTGTSKDESEDDDDDDDEDDDDDDEEENIVASRPNGKSPGVFSTSSGSVPVPSPADPEADAFFKLSYVYIMIASAVVTFMVASVLFFVCRRSALERTRKKAHLAATAPFVLSDRGPGHLGPDAHKKTSIVKNYQRVPTTTREFLHSDYHYHAAATADSCEKKKPLLP